MRTVVLILAVVGLMAFNSCKQEPDVQAMLENTETRNEIIETIANNPDYMNDFMANMQGNKQAMQMMQGNHKMMNMMMGEGMNMMNDSVMSMNMMHSMMKDRKMMNHMMQMMQNEGMMSEDCMNSTMQMMTDKGMKMGGMADNSGNNKEG